MTRFIDMLPPNICATRSLCGSPLAIEQAIEAFEDDGGNWEEVPMLCGVVIASFAINAKTRMLVAAIR